MPRLNTHLGRKSRVSSGGGGGSILRAPTNFSSYLGTVSSAVPRLRGAPIPDTTMNPQLNRVPGIFETGTADQFSNVMLGTAIRVHERDTRLRAQEHFFDFKERMTSRLFDPENGFFTKEGKEAVDSHQAYQEAVEEEVKTTLEGVDEYTQLALMEMLGPARNQYLNLGARHTQEQYDVWEKRSSEKNVLKSFQDMQLYLGNDQALSEFITSASETLGFKTEAEQMMYRQKAFFTAAQYKYADPGTSTEDANKFVNRIKHELTIDDLKSLKINEYTAWKREEAKQNEIKEEQEAQLKLFQKHNAAQFLSDQLSGKKWSDEKIAYYIDNRFMTGESFRANFKFAEYFSNLPSDRFLKQAAVTSAVRTLSERERSNKTDEYERLLAAGQISVLAEKMKENHPENYAAMMSMAEDLREGEINAGIIDAVKDFQNTITEVKTIPEEYVKKFNAILDGDEVDLFDKTIGLNDIKKLTDLTKTVADKKLDQDIQSARRELEARIKVKPQWGTRTVDVKSNIAASQAVAGYIKLRTEEKVSHEKAMQAMVDKYVEYQRNHLPDYNYNGSSKGIHTAHDALKAFNQLEKNRPGMAKEVYVNARRRLMEYFQYFSLRGELQPVLQQIEERKFQRPEIGGR
jgi:hypothetical protein